MQVSLTLPPVLAVMTLPGVTFFPGALMPLHIFEPRYRAMLSDVLDGDRLFAVASLDTSGTASGFEPLCRVATAGIVRACQGREDGTSHLLLEGVSRINVLGIVHESPYRRIQITPLTSRPGAGTAENAHLRARLARLLRTRLRLGSGDTAAFARFLQDVEDPEIFTDLAAFHLCEDPRTKQRLLETLDIHERLTLLHHWAHRDVMALRLRAKLQGRLPDEAIGNN